MYREYQWRFEMKVQRKVVVTVAAVAALGGGGAAIAASGLTGSASHQAIVTDAATKLGVDPARLDAALIQAEIDQVNAEVKAGTLTQAQADEMIIRIKAGDSQVLGGDGGGRDGHHGFGFGQGSLEAAAASYLGITAAELTTAQDAGKSLAQLATDKGKDLAGLKAALNIALTKDLDAAVSAGQITAAQKTQELADAASHIDQEVTETGGEHGGPDGGAGGSDGNDTPVTPSTTPATPTPSSSSSSSGA